jgi:SAM-dependent methyltransferase
MSEGVVRHDENCRLCGSNRITVVLKFKDTPLEDQFVREEAKEIEQPLYPLDVALCEACGYVHLPYLINPTSSYADYVYVSGVTVGLRDHFNQYAKEIVEDFRVPKESLAIDLGSNDGSMLASFKSLGMKVLGVEPATSIAGQANKIGLPTINAFFTDSVVGEILALHGKAGIITANYMYANVEDVIGFTKNVAKLLAPNGVFVVQTGYHPEQMKINMFDYVYHEHFSYFTVDVLKNVFSRCGLELVHVEKTSPKGGSIRIVGQLKGGNLAIDPSVDRMIADENNAGMRKIETYKEFALGLLRIKEQLLEKLVQLKISGKKIVGFGASHSTTTLLYHFEIAPFLDYLVDDNILKHGTYSPGNHIPVYSSELLYKDKPDYVVMLAWQHQSSILSGHQKYIDDGGHWVIPLPELKII